MRNKTPLYVFFSLVCLSLVTPLIVDKNYLFPFILPRALFLRIVLDLALPFYLYLILARREYRPNLKNPLNLAVLAFLGLNFISAFAGVNPLRSVWGNIERMGGAWYLLHLVMLYFYVQLLAQASGRLILRFLKIFLWISIASVLYGVWVYAGLPGFYADPSLPSRVSSSFGNPIFFASFLILPLFLTVFFALQEESRFWKAVYWVAAFLQLLGIYQSATRGAFVGLVIGVFAVGVIYLFRAPAGRLRLYGLSAVGGLVLVVGVLFAANNKLASYPFLYRITHLRDSNTSARLIQWKTALEGFKDKPVLGVGPENYYLISNKYYNPEMARYDASWFDKPHNYLLEILVTTGAAGSLAYLAVLAFFAWALFKAYKADLLTWLEASLLLGGMLVYQIQNLFVFDTISASVAFFVYLGFGAYLWHEAGTGKKQAGKSPRQGLLSQAFLNTALVTAMAVAIYAIYLTGVVPGRVAKNINYGYAYSSVSAAKAYDYFETARNQPFVFDPGELGTRYEDFAANLVRNPSDKTDKAIVNKALDGAIAALEKANEKMDNYPIFWYKLAEAYAIKDSANNLPLDAKVNEAAEKAAELAPKRMEILSFMAQLRLAQGRIGEAVSLAEQVAGFYPFNPDAKWRLAYAYNAAKREADAVRLAEEALAQGYQIKNSEDIKWLANYYAGKKQFDKAEALYQQGIKNNPQDGGMYAALANFYANAGMKDKAIETAKQYQQINPNAAAQVSNFIKQLVNSTSSPTQIK